MIRTRTFFIIIMLLFVVLPSQAQMKNVTGRVLQKEFGNKKPKPFDEEVHVFAFNMKTDYKKALVAVEKPGAFITNYDSEAIADEEGYYTVQVAPTGYILVVVGGITHDSQEVKQRLVIDFVLESGLKLQNVTVTGRAMTATVDSMDVIDTGGTIECSSIITIPDGVGKSNARCVFQPMVIDCMTGDTVQYLPPRVFDGPEYSKLQLQRMGYDMRHDKLYPYIDKQPLSLGRMKIRWSASIKKRDRKRSYTCMAGMRIADYNSIFYSEDKQISSCMARHPFQFLECNMALPDLDKMQYKETPRGELREGAENISLSFKLGSTELNDDPQNEAELERLNEVFQKIDRSGEYQIRRIAITGYASPEGNYQANLNLAKRRAEAAKGLVGRNFQHEVYIYTENPKVIGWDVVADSLQRKGYLNEAAELREVMKKSASIQALPFYKDLIEPILPHLRLFKCEYAYQTVRALEPAEIIENYLHNSDYREGGPKQFNHYEYWNLFESIKDPKELEYLYARAYKESKENSNRPWVYAAHKLAMSYLNRDTCDVEVLRPFIDINAKNVNIERTTFSGRKYMINQEEIVAAQVANYYREELNDTAYYLARMLPDKPQYQQVKSFALVRGLLFRPNKTDEQKNQLNAAMDVVEASSSLNKAVLEVATRRDQQAAETLKLLDDSDPRKWYLLGILDSRAGDNQAAASNLNEAIKLDRTFQMRMVNDGDISDDVKEVWEFTYGNLLDLE
ncbi:MAG: hypothetical protein MJZ69_06830 [Bacteroidaceae bacterium]|nr:hypothetical protein [Bacteroidaceae bacterium]